MGRPVIHFEVVGKDGDALRTFYSELFGWEIDADNPLNYGVVNREGNTTSDGVGIGGGVASAQPGSEGHVTFYVDVPDIEAALADAERFGGTKLWGPLKATDQIELGQFTDPEGHVIGLMHALT
jgi:predicted enzyme related to lactoylglutathione lyase